MIKKIFTFMVILSMTVYADITGVWYSHPNNEDVISVVEVYKENGKYYAYGFDYKTSGVKEMNDIKNPNPDLKKYPLTGLIFFYDLEFNGKEYRNGKIYNPDNGKTFNLKVKQKGNTLELRASMDKAGVFGKTLKWNKAENSNSYKSIKKSNLRLPF